MWSKRNCLDLRRSIRRAILAEIHDALLSPGRGPSRWTGRTLPDEWEGQRGATWIGSHVRRICREEYELAKRALRTGRGAGGQ